MIENDISMMKFENDEICEEIILLKLSLSRFVRIFHFYFYCFRGSILKYFDLIVIKGFTFPSFCVFCSSLCPSLNNTMIFNLEKKNFYQKGTKIESFNSMNLDLLKDGIDWALFSSNFHERMRGDISIERMISFSSSKSFIAMKLFPYSIIGKNDFGFVMKEREEAEFSMKNESESIESEMKYCHEMLQLSGGSLWESNFSVRELKSNGCFEIDSSVEDIELKDFFQWGSLKAIIFRSDSHLRKIDGFAQCTSLCRIEIPLSVEMIEWNGFYKCTSLNEVIFSSESPLREIHGFQHCTSLCRIIIPS
jgi:hypothetical protein